MTMQQGCYPFYREPIFQTTPFLFSITTDFPPPQKKTSCLYVFIHIYVIHNTIQNYSFLKSHYTSAFWRQHISMFPTYFYYMWPFSAFWCTTLLFHHIKPKSMPYFNNVLLINFHKCLSIKPNQIPVLDNSVSTKNSKIHLQVLFNIPFRSEILYFVHKSIVLNVH